jgi:hypothetical protein
MWGRGWYICSVVHSSLNQIGTSKLRSNGRKYFGWRVHRELPENTIEIMCRILYVYIWLLWHLLISALARSLGRKTMAESTVRWFVARVKHCTDNLKWTNKAAWLKNYGWQYCSLIGYERKILLDGWQIRQISWNERSYQVTGNSSSIYSIGIYPFQITNRFNFSLDTS